MEFFKTLFKNRKLVLQIGKNDFKNRFANTSLGAVWGFVSPFIFMMTYVIVFQYILKTGSAGNSPYVVWFLPGMSMWMFLNDSINSGSNSIRNYSYLVKKIVFPVDVIPIISLISSSIISVFLFIISIVVCAIYGYVFNPLMLIYMFVCAICFVVAFTRFTSAITTLVPDFAQLLGIIMQLFFWFTPVIWNISMLHGGVLEKVVKSSPFTYLINGFRQVFLNASVNFKSEIIYSIIFWSITILIFLWGNYIFNKNKKDFADVL